MSTRTRMRALTATAFTAAALAATTLAASPASAAPTVDLHCEAGGGTMLCDVYISGATGAQTVRWRIRNVPKPALNDRTTILAPCPVGQVVNVRVTVTDSAGSASDSANPHCHAIWP